jgi:hypothetical protein
LPLRGLSSPNKVSRHGLLNVPDYQKFRAGSPVGEPLLSTSHEVEVPAALFVGSASYSWGEDELTTPDATISNARARLSDFKHLAGSDTALRTGVTVAQDSEHNKGGRPPLDADDFWIEIVRLANLPDGLPDQHELVPHMLEFSPDRSENWVRGKLRKLYRRVQKP